MKNLHPEFLMHFSKQQEDSSDGISKHSSSIPNLSQQNPHPNCTKLAL
jgi:hypothetical protein